MLSLPDRSMNIDEIEWHDSEIVKVVEGPADSVLAFQVLYPTDWKNNVFEEKTILFHDFFEYEVNQWPDVTGPEQILSAVPLDPQPKKRHSIYIETTRGYRRVCYSSLELADGHIPA